MHVAYDRLLLEQNGAVLMMTVNRASKRIRR